MTDDVLVVVQARTGSTRLPGKVLRDVGGMPMLELQLRRLRGLRRFGFTVVVATSDLPSDDPIAELGSSLDTPVVRGSEGDVLARFITAAREFPADHVVRLTGDCPFTDPRIVEDAVALHAEVDADYTSNVLPRSFPKGLDVEVVTTAALEVAHDEATDGSDREHVTPYLYRRPERFRLANLHSGASLGEEWWTVDTSQDLERVRAMVEVVGEPTTASWMDILETVGGASPPADGTLVLESRTNPEPGSDPWTRSWTATVAGKVVGTIEVAVGSGAVAVRNDTTADWAAAAEAALQRLLAGDQQTRP